MHKTAASDVERARPRLRRQHGRAARRAQTLGQMLGQTLGPTLALALGLPLILPGAALAQEGGRSLSLTFSQSLSATQNLALVPGGSGTTLQAITGAALSWETATLGQSFGLDAGLNLRAADPAGAEGFSANLDNPRLALSYSRTAPGSSLSLSASAALADVEYLRDLFDYIIETGLYPEDLADLQGSGQRRNADASFSLSLRDDAPFGLTLSGQVHDIAYWQVSDPELVDSTRLVAGLTARLALNPVTEATIGLTRTELRTEGAGSTTRLALSTGLGIDRPDGTLSFGLTATDTGAGTQLGFTASRALALPGGNALSGSLGATLLADDTLVATGALSLSRAIETTRFSFALDRKITFDAETADLVQTSLALGLTHDFSPRLSGTFSAGYVREEGEGTRTDIADLSAGLGYLLTEQTRLSATAGWQQRSETPGAAADALSLSLMLSRTFAARR